MRTWHFVLGVCILSACIAAAAATPADTHPVPPALPNLLLGTAWYPEQWDEPRWEKDLQLMEAAGIHMVRVGEFAWSRMEPQEGQFDFDWLEHAIAAAGKHHIYVVLGTPTAAPPAWLTQRYPEVLRVEEDGRRATHGNRVHFSFTSSRYRQFCRRIAEEMARRFGQNPNVIGWQIDNEYSTVSYDQETARQFHEFLKARYQSLDNLNRSWTTSYWSQTYDNWDEIPLPIGGHNPGLMLEFKRFIGETYRSYQHDQVTAIRAHAVPSQFITHNFMGWFDGFDHYVLSSELDLASWDDYVGTGHLDADANGMIHDLTRGFKRRNYWVMETQPGAVNWSPNNNALDRGEVREMAWQAIGHGADTVSYWQWRSALNGQEQYHGTLVGQDGEPVPLYAEVTQIGQEFAKAAPALRGTTPVSTVALLQDYDSRWAIQFQRHNQKFDTFGHFASFYRPLRSLAPSIDIVHPSAPLSAYRLVIAPHLNVLPEATAKHLLEYVQNGGHLVLGARSGMKDEHNALLPVRQPGPVLAPALGTQVEQFYALEKPVPVTGKLGNGTTTIWAERLNVKSPDVEVLMRYGKSNGWLDDQPAVVTRAVGRGRITYVAGWFDETTMANLAKWATQISGIQAPLLSVPTGVELCRRAGDGKQVFVVINHTSSEQQVSLPRPMRDVLKETKTTKLILPAREVAVLALEQ